jgi:hypothetical protein
MEVIRLNLSIIFVIMKIQLEKSVRFHTTELRSILKDFSTYFVEEESN